MTEFNEKWVAGNGATIAPEIPPRRLGGPHNLKAIAVLLASQASDFMAGAIIVVDRAATAW